jgi:hypothetical protein
MFGLKLPIPVTSVQALFADLHGLCGVRGRGRRATEESAPSSVRSASHTGQGAPGAAHLARAVASAVKSTVVSEVATATEP